jgi:hypothetical protein
VGKRNVICPTIFLSLDYVLPIFSDWIMSYCQGLD